MLNVYVTQHHQAGEITVQDNKRQKKEDELTRSNWRYFHAMQTSGDSPNPGDGRRDDSPKSGNNS